MTSYTISFYTKINHVWCRHSHTIERDKLPTYDEVLAIIRDKAAILGSKVIYRPTAQLEEGGPPRYPSRYRPCCG